MGNRKEIQNKESIERKLELVNNRIDIETDDDVITEMLILKERLELNLIEIEVDSEMEGVKV